MAPPTRVSKRVFLGALTCPTRAWFLRHLPAPTPTPGEKLRMQEGNEIGERARRLFPDGILVEDRDPQKAAVRTAQLMADPEVKVIFEATFLAGDYVARADILIRERKRWQVTEVKSNVNLKDELIEDLAYTVNVARHAGIRVSSPRLMLLSPDYRRGMTDQELFQYHDATEDVEAIVEQFEEIWDDVPNYIQREKPIEPQLVWDCRSCEFFETDCLGKDAEDHVFNLPYFREPTFRRLVKLEITSIDSIPDGFPLSEQQLRVRRAVGTRKPVVDHSGLSRAMESIEFPAHYLDFETVKTAVPVFDGLRPHASIVTQYSVLRRESPDHDCDHFEYLADHRRDCRRELTERLIQDLGSSGSIFVYSSYEKTMLRMLAKMFPDLDPELEGCIERLFDLQKPFKSWFCHPDCCGSTSIKATLPALCDLDYLDLEVRDGDTAVAHFARLMRGEVEPPQIDGIRNSLLAYCKRDTLAMVKLHDVLLEHCGS